MTSTSTNGANKHIGVVGVGTGGIVTGDRADRAGDRGPDTQPAAAVKMCLDHSICLCKS